MITIVVTNWDEAEKCGLEIEIKREKEIRSKATSIKIPQ